MSPRLGELLYGPSFIIKGLILTENLVIVSHSPAVEFQKPVPFTNVIYAAITTATARLKLLEAMEKIGDNLIYTGTFIPLKTAM